MKVQVNQLCDWMEMRNCFSCFNFKCQTLQIHMPEENLIFSKFLVCALDQADLIFQLTFIYTLFCFLYPIQVIILHTGDRLCPVKDKVLDHWYQKRQGLSKSIRIYLHFVFLGLDYKQIDSFAHVPSKYLEMS